MDAKCGNCGLVTEISDEVLRKRLVDFMCQGCGTMYWATQNGCRPLRRSAARRARSPRPSAPELSPVSRDVLDDLRAIAAKSRAHQASNAACASGPSLPEGA